MDYGRRIVLPFKTIDNRRFFIYSHALSELVKELELFLEQASFMDSKTFSKKVMFTHEIKANNTIEGINDDVTLIEAVIKNANTLKDIERRNRIINLYQAYKYILKGDNINSETVKYLYSILSKDLLSYEDRSRMGEYYRNGIVYILRNGRLDDSVDYGVDPSLIEEYMSCYFDFVNSPNNFQNSTEYYIKSQLMHFYFVYIHPYFDINGRSSRTIAMWYLLNNQIYPYIIFNRGINFMSHYDRTIWECKESHNLTRFLEYMLISVKKELEKEYIVHNLTQDSTRQWTTQEFQTLEYFLSMKNEQKTVLDFISMYNRFNEKKSNREIFETMIQPLLDENILESIRTTNKNIFNNTPNMVLELSKKKLSNINTEKITRLPL